MKLLSLKYRDPNNRLKAYDFDFANGRELSGRKLEPLCFVGLNGSGKSKLIELLAEIFFTLDANRKHEASAHKQRQCKSNFTLHYKLRPGRGFQVVRVEGKQGSEPVIYVDDATEALAPTEWDAVLPSNIVGYSSGHNETISPLFLDLRQNDLGAALKQLESGQAGDVEQTRTLFLDRDTTKLLLLTTYLFEGVKGLKNFPTRESSRALLQRFREFIRLDRVLSFQLIIDTQKDHIKLSRRMADTLSKLQRCALMTDTARAKNERRYVLDFFVNDIAREALVKSFETPQAFFSALYELNSLNLLNKGAKAGTEVFSIPDAELKVVLNSPQAEATYQSLSDGEHQFIQIFGAAVLFGRDDSLFLLDEPESHFNPAWRAKFVFLLDELLGEKQKSAEFLISTHSPYLVSACKKSNVVKFVRDEHGISFDRLEEETYGASFDVLLKALFDMRGLVAEIAKKDLQAVVQSEASAESRIERLETEFGDSYEKRLLINMLRKGLLDVVPGSAG